MSFRKRIRHPLRFRAYALLALAVNGGNIKRTARELEVPRRTLGFWASGRSRPVPPAAMAEAIEDLNAMFERTIMRMLDTFTKEDWKKVGLVERTRALCLVLDAMLLLRG
jgi:hypothetical protein